MSVHSPLLEGSSQGLSDLESDRHRFEIIAFIFGCGTDSNHQQALATRSGSSVIMLFKDTKKPDSNFISYMHASKVAC